jgi:hypothetical protein
MHVSLDEMWSGGCLLLLFRYECPARQQILDATLETGMVPRAQGLMREDAISVLVQHT